MSGCKSGSASARIIVILSCIYEQGCTQRKIPLMDGRKLGIKCGFYTSMVQWALRPIADLAALLWEGYGTRHEVPMYAAETLIVIESEAIYAISDGIPQVWDLSMLYIQSHENAPLAVIYICVPHVGDQEFGSRLSQTNDIKLIIVASLGWRSALIG